MKELLALIQKHMAETKAKVNAALEAAPPVDQVEGANGFLALVNSAKWLMQDIERIEKEHSDFTLALESYAAAQATARIDQEVAAANLIRKTDHELAIAAAKKEGEKEAETRIAAERAEEKAAAARREELGKQHGKEVADALPENVFALAVFTDTTKAEITRRVEALKEIGVTAADKPAHFAEIVACGAFDEEGGKVFDGRMTLLKDLVKPPATPPARKAVPGSGAPQFAAASKQEEAPKNLAVF
jgi:hypothetical protein